MKTYIVLPHQYVSVGYNENINSSVHVESAILPKKMVEDNNNHILQHLTYRDLLLTLDSEFDVIATSNRSVYDSIIVDDNRDIQLSITRLDGKIAYLEDDVVEFLGYKSSKLITKKGMKIARYTSNGNYFVFINHLYNIPVNKKESLIPMCKELVDKKYVGSIDIKIGEAINQIITLTNDPDINSDIDLEEIITELKNAKKKVQIRSLYFNKVFNRDEANDLLRIITQCVDLPNLTIRRAELEDLYILV